MENIIKLAISLVILVLSNITLGSMDAYFEKTFDKEKFAKGFLKGMVVIAVFIAVYFAGGLTPDITIEGMNVNLSMAVYIIVLAAFYHYAKEVITKLIKVTKSEYKFK